MTAATLPHLPIQEDAELKPGYCLNPFEPLWLGSSPGEGIGADLYAIARKIDDDRNDFDWLSDFDEETAKIKQSLFAWYEIALKTWKIKLFKAWKGQFTSFREWCETALGCTVASINSKIRAARVLSQLIGLGFERIPASPSVALELSKVDWETLGDTWRDICDRYADHEITAEKVASVMADPLGEKPKLKQIRIPAEQWEQLRGVAAAGGLSPSRLLQKLLADYLGESDGTEAIAERISTAEPDQKNSEGEPVGDHNPQGQDDAPDLLPDDSNGKTHGNDPDAQGQKPSNRNLSKDSQGLGNQKPRSNPPFLNPCDAPTAFISNGLYAKPPALTPVIASASSSTA